MQGGKRDPWWLEAFVLSRAVFGILFWPVAAIVGAIVALGLLFAAFTENVVWGLLVLAAIVAVIFAFAWWDSHRPRG